MSTASAVIVRLKPSLLRNTLIAVVVGGVPLFGVLAWLGVVHGTLVLVIVSVAVVVFAVTFSAWRHVESYVRVENGEVRKVTFASSRVIPTADVAQIVICETDDTASPDTVPQLLALDAAGRRLFRMRGLFWSLDDMHTVADAVGAPVVVDSAPMTRQQFYSKYTGAAYWYEGRTWLAALGIATIAAVASGLVLLIMTIAGAF